MSSMLIENVFIGGLDGSGPISVRIDGGLIIEAGVGLLGTQADAVFDWGGATIFPGFIDVHNHGAVGVDVNVADVDGLLEIAGFLAQNGVTAWVPTVVPDSDENYARIIGAIDRLMEVQVGRPVAQAVGVHYEGVFANEKMCGALRPEFFKTFRDVVVSEKSGTTKQHENTQSNTSGTTKQHGTTRNKTEDHPVIGLPRLKNGIHMTTLAPEVDGGIELIEALVGRGWIASIGHTRACVDTLDRAFATGARHVTHFFNAMTGIHHRDVGVAGWALTNDEVTFDIIADGIHVHPKMLEFACRRKSPEMSLLISDSAAPTGLGDGEFELWGETITVTNGRTQNERGSIAGSVITMLDAVKQMRSLEFSDQEVSMMASLNPAKLLGIDKTHGSIEVGKRADLVAIDESGEIKMVMIGGRDIDL